MGLLDRFFVTDEDRDRASRYARLAMTKHGNEAEQSLRAMLADHRRTKSKRAVRMAIKIVAKASRA